jgi:pimeloyl-ACP methyl ester carboxylesterase
MMLPAGGAKERNEVATADIDGMRIEYELIGDGRPWVITPGGRFSKDTPGVRQLAEELAGHGNQVLIWDRPNTGASDVNFTGNSESEMQADTLAGLLRHLDLGPTIIVGGSGGSRVSLLTGARHPDVAAAMGLLWISGGTYGLMLLGVVYAGDPIKAAWTGGMEAVVELPAFKEVLERNPRNRQLFLDQDPREFIDTLERWMRIYCPVPGVTVPGLIDADYAKIDIPTVVFRSGAADPHHPRVTSETVAGLIPGARLLEPPWGDREWIERSDAAVAKGEGLFQRWPLLAPQLLEFAATIPPR